MTIGFPPSSAPGAEHWQPVTPLYGGALSFSGQGHDIWQNPPSVTPGPSAAPSAFAGSRPAANELSARPQMFLPRRRPPIVYPIYGGYFGNGFLYNPFLFGFGFGGCDPFDPFWNFDCNAFGYMGGYGYGSGYGYYPYVYAPSPYATANDASDDSGQYATQDNLAASNDTSAAVTVLYLKSGTSFAVADYWLDDGKLEYVTPYGGANSVDLDELDIPRTVTDNAARGVSFVLRPEPGPAPAAPPVAPAPDQQ